MTDFSAAKLRALDEVLHRLAETLATVPDDSPDHASLYLDMRHGEGREIRAAILAMAEREKRLREALESIADHNKVRDWTATSDNPETHWVTRDGFYAVIARQALGEEKA